MFVLTVAFEVNKKWPPFFRMTSIYYLGICRVGLRSASSPGTSVHLRASFNLTLLLFHNSHCSFPSHSSQGALLSLNSLLSYTKCTLPHTQSGTLVVDHKTGLSHPPRNITPRSLPLYHIVNIQHVWIYRYLRAFFRKHLWHGRLK